MPTEMQPLAQNDDHEAQVPLVQEETVGQRAGWGFAAKVGASISALALLVVALVSSHGAAPADVNDGVRSVSGLQGDLDPGAEEVLNAALGADRLQKDLVDDMPIYTDLVGIDQHGDPSTAKIWTIELKSEFEDMPYDERQSLAASIFDETQIHEVSEVIPEFSVKCTFAELKTRLAGHHEKIQFVEQDVKDSIISMFGRQRRLTNQINPPSWGLNRVDERDLPMGQNYKPDDKSNDGRGVHIYVMDTGVRTTHEDFGGRAIPTLEVIGNGKVQCAPDNHNCANDVDGHGTHCAATAAGTKFGVAKQATIHAVKILADDGTGSFSWFKQGIDWIIAHGARPAVTSASLGGPGKLASVERAFNIAVSRGVVVVVAAGNENDDACGYTPAYIPSAIAVASTDQDDGRSSFSNYGSCIDIFAPGGSIVSADEDSDSGRDTMSGTSMACPHVAGAAALIFAEDPGRSAESVINYMKRHATIGEVHNLGEGTTNKLLYVGDAGDEGASTPRPPPPSGGDCADLGWKVVDGECQIDSDCCLTSPNYGQKNYANDGTCRVKIGSDPGLIEEKAFSTEGDWDHLHIPTLSGEVLKYNGHAGPKNIVPAPGGEILWSPDSNVADSGFKLCLPNVGECPENGWIKQDGCVAAFNYGGIRVEGCSLDGHNGGAWCVKKHRRGHYYWSNCIQCRA